MTLTVRLFGRELLALTWTPPGPETLFEGEPDHEYTTADLEAHR